MSRPAFLHVLCFLFLPAWALPVWATTDTTSDEFYKKREAQIRQEYLACTNDSSNASFDRILKWKQQLNAWVSSPVYDSVFKKYQDATGLLRNIRPCEVRAWAMEQQAEAAKELDETGRVARKRAQIVADSLLVAGQLALCPPSKFDFPGMPFGITRKALSLMVPAKCPTKTTPYYDHITADRVAVGRDSLMAAFYFTAGDTYYQYELQSLSYGADSLDICVRLIAERTSKILEGKLGLPDHIYRVGFFEIVQGRLTPYKTWHSTDHTAIVGYGTYKHRYYAKALVVNKTRAPQ